MYCVPSHPKTSLTRCYRWQVFIRVFRGGALCQHFCCLTCDVFIKLNKLVQIHDPWCFHNATAFVNLKIQRKWGEKPQQYTQPLPLKRLQFVWSIFPPKRGTNTKSNILGKRSLPGFQIIQQENKSLSKGIISCVLHLWVSEELHKFI